VISQILLVLGLGYFSLHFIFSGISKRSVMKVSAGGIIAAIAISQVFFYGIAIVPTGSMVPAIPKLSVVGFNVRDNSVEEGQIYLIRVPGKVNYRVKRLVGLPGDTVVWGKRSILINGKDLKVYLGDCSESDKEMIIAFMDDSEGDIVLGEGKAFFLGDNYCNSDDSRVFGPVNIKNIVGKIKV
jgi:signal peptidase I